MQFGPLLGLVLGLEQVPHGTEPLGVALAGLGQEHVGRAEVLLYPPASPQIALIRSANGIS